MNLNSKSTETGTETGTEIETVFVTDTQTQTEEGTNNNSENKQNINTNTNELTKFEKLENILNNILTRIDNMEKTYVSLNADLIKQNIVMTELLNGKLKEPDFEMPDLNNTNSNNNNNSNDSNSNNISNGTNENGTVQKDLFYYENNNKIIVYGPGTYDNRSVLGPYGSWNSINKSWDLVVEKNILLEKIPYLIYKMKEMED